MKFLSCMILAAMLAACAVAVPPPAGTAPACTVADPSGCKPHKVVPTATPAKPLPEEVVSFYEGTPEENLPDETAAEPAVVEHVIGEEVEAEIGKTDIEKIPKFDIPIVVNKQVEKWIDYFQGSGRKVFTAWLARSERYVPLFKGILRENGLPEDLIYLAMIESGFKPYAYSRAKASGPWQFIKRTGQNYGLRVNWWLDERRDPEKSTIAAAQHLKDLYDEFNSWYLAAAGYNAGRGKVARAIERYSTEDFWEMSRYGYLKAETKNYVPKMIAAALLAKDPERYGFTDVPYEEPLTYDKVTVPEPTELSAAAKALGIDIRTLVELNPDLKRNITPPNYPNYELKVPVGYAEKFTASYSEIRRNTVPRVIRHVVGRRDTLQSIAAEYGVATQTIVVFNHLRSNSVRRGQQLAIPIRLPTGEPVRDAAVRTRLGKKPDVYAVRSGDTLWSISRRFDVSVSELRKWNRLNGQSGLKVGTRLKLYARSDPAMLVPSRGLPGKGPGPDAWKTYRVQRGDTLWSIAKKNGVRPSDLAEWNRLEPNGSDLRPGSELRIRAVNL
ncbi:MAG: LysM peptidoglycan-binding domain-containing protein [Pseudomonadota bacterium]